MIMITHRAHSGRGLRSANVGLLRDPHLEVFVEHNLIKSTGNEVIGRSHLTWGGCRVIFRFTCKLNSKMLGNKFDLCPFAQVGQSWTPKTKVDYYNHRGSSRNHMRVSIGFI